MLIAGDSAEPYAQQIAAEVSIAGRARCGHLNRL